MRTIVSEVTGIAGQKQAAASARSQLYLLFSDSFHVPDEEFYADVRSGNFKKWILNAVDGLPYSLDVKEIAQRLDAAVEYEELNSEFMSLFEVGIPAPKCPLNESQFISGKSSVLEDLVRFYNFFDLSAAKARELPDHLRIELDFMHFLTFKEAEKLHAGSDPGAFVRAERDFLQRHLGRWTPLLHEKVEQCSRLDFFKCLTNVLASFISSECTFLQGEAAV